MAERTTSPRGPATWLNHLELRPGDLSVTTSHNAIQSHGLIVSSSTTGDIAQGGGNKVVTMAVHTLPDYLITGVRICYELSNTRTFISQIRLSQTQHPPNTQLVMLDDGTDHTDPGPRCVNSAGTSIDPAKGAVTLSLRVNVGNTSDRINILAVGLHLQSMS
ncbi:MAG: hypothetical protein ACJ77A_10325 [Actinomycetota bacterium]